MLKLDALSISLIGILLVGLVEGAKWLAPYHQLTEAGCAVGFVYDGDSVELICPSDKETARLVGFDTPETKNPKCEAELNLGKKATTRMRSLIGAGPYLLDHVGVDKYHRPLVRITRDGENLGNILIKEGLAVRYSGGKRPNWCDLLSQ